LTCRRAVKRGFQRTSGRQRAVHRNAIDDAQIFLHGDDDVADAYRGRLTTEQQAATPTARGMEITELRELVDHLAQVLERDAVVRRDLAHRAHAAVPPADEKHYAQRVIGKAGELHGGYDD